MKKKIAHITFDMCIGGAEQVIRNLLENTNSSKYDVSILCLEKQIGPFGMELVDSGCTVIPFGREPGLDFRLIKKIRKYLLEKRIDIIHCHQYTPYIYGLFASVGTKIKVVFTEHGRFHPDRKKFKRVLINPVLSFFTDHIIAISVATGKALVTYENFPKKKIEIIYNGIGDARFLLSPLVSLKKSLGIPDGAFVLGTVARLDSIKNQELMIRALKMILKTCPDIYLVLIGDGPERESLEALSFELQLDSHIIFTGFKQDTHHYYKILDVFLLTSFSEGTAMTLLEAMASSVPCIVTNVGGNPEIVIDGETGCVIADDDEKALVQSIRILHEDRNLLFKMGKAGRKRFEEHFTVEKMVQSYEALYN